MIKDVYWLFDVIHTLHVGTVFYGLVWEGKDENFASLVAEACIAEGLTLVEKNISTIGNTHSLL